MEEYLNCTICCIDYDNDVHTPRQFSCQHHLCSICLPYMKKTEKNKDYFECPTCRLKHFIPLNSVPKSRFILDLIQTTKPKNDKSKSQYSQNNKTNVITDSIRSQPPRSPQQVQFSQQPNQSHSSNAPMSTYSQGSSQTNQPKQWDQNSYLRAIFSSMDINNDGSITSNELKLALQQVQSTADFNKKTIDLLISKYDKNGDKEISFEEFIELFSNLNDEFLNFLIMDSDGSGTIDLNEFSTSINNKGFQFSNKFFDYIMDEIRKHTGEYGIKFDNYIRIMARFDFLCQSYRNTPYFHKNPLEHYLTKTFFQDFW